MAMSKSAPKSVNAYIAQFPKDTQRVMKQVRALIKKAAPKAEERISYGIAGYFLNGMLVYFAAYKKHIGFYPGAEAIAYFKKEVAGYKLSKGTVQLPLDEPIPVGLLTRIVKYRLKMNAAKKAR